MFGSNLAGRHGAGAALHARRFCGAIYGKGEGRMGESYAIPTKDEYLMTRSLAGIQKSVDKFKEYASDHLDLQFKVTAVGTGLAGHRHCEIAPMFKGSPPNCEMPMEWREWL